MNYLTANVFSCGENISLVNQFVLVDCDCCVDIIAMCNTYLNKFNLSNCGHELSIVNDRSLDIDGYHTQITCEGKIFIKFSNIRSLSYALIEINELAASEGDQLTLPKLIVDDYPSFPIRGVIEGFYGEPYSHDTRLELLSFLQKNRLNSYFYAPKDDIYHREKWRIPYPSDLLSGLSKLIVSSKERYIDFWFCISPGKDYDFCSSLDLDVLCAKLQQMYELGVSCFALLMDDIEACLSAPQKKLFHSSAQAQSDLANKVQSYLLSICTDAKLVFCPTDYFQNFDNEYRQDINKYLCKEIAVFWTGYNTIAEIIPNGDAKRVKDSFGHELVLWDNYPVNDFNPKSRIYLDAICNRDTRLADSHIGYVINPMWQWNLSRIAVATMADYAWNSTRYIASLSLDRVVSQLAYDNCSADMLKVFVDANSSNITHLSSFDIKMNTAFDKCDFDALDGIYSLLMAATNSLMTMENKKLLGEMLPYLDYIAMENKVYQNLKNGSLNEESVLQLSRSEARTSNQFLLKYIKKHKLVSRYEEIIIDEKRCNFWEYQQINGLPSGTKK